MNAPPTAIDFPGRLENLGRALGERVAAGALNLEATRGRVDALRTRVAEVATR